jgi:SAM-dependent methyltransferase
VAHPEQEEFIRLLSSQLSGNFNNCDVLEIGSLNINGSVRKHFHECNYIGIDIAPGKDVDIVCQGQNYDAPNDSFDTVLSCEAMEHNPYWLETFRNMIRICKPGGLIAMSCATTGRGEHGTERSGSSWASPLTVEVGWSYYRNLTARDFEENIRLSDYFSIYRFWTNWSVFDLYFVGIKKNDSLNEDVILNASPAFDAINAFVARNNGLISSQIKQAICSNTLGESGVNFLRHLKRIVITS